MRISDTQFSQMMLHSLQSNNQGLGKVFQQMSTRQRMTNLSDDPISAIKLINMDREASALNQYMKNVENVKTTLSAQEVGLEAVNSTLKEMRDLILWGANGTMTKEDREGIVTKLETLKDSMVSSMNTQDEEGNYLFSGTESDKEAVVKTAAGYVVQGNSDKRLVTVAKGVTIESNNTAKEMLNIGGTNVLNQIDSIIAEFRAPTANFSLVKTDAIQAIDDTLGNVLNAITSIGGRHNNLDLLNSGHSENKLFVDGATTELKQLNYAEASVRLESYKAALEATQLSYMKINGLSLFNKM